MVENCFVIMAISAQTNGESIVTSDDLRSAYDDVIKVALLNARPNINVVRADDYPVPGTITTDILNHLMHDKYVVVDITYPNPNVYYELGIRNCCKPGTILIKNKDSKINAPFDISHQRFIEYECTPKGIKNLIKSFWEAFNWLDQNSGVPDNQVLHLAKFSKYNFPQYGSTGIGIESMAEIVTMFFQNPDIMAAVSNKSLQVDDRNRAIMDALSKTPEGLKTVVKAIMTNKDMK